MGAYLWNVFGARLKFIRCQTGKPLNWLFLPGGPGLGSESLHDLIDCLDLPGTSWCLDLPGDGSNTTSNNTQVFSKWREALVDVVSAFENVILVCHSTGGMFALAEPLLEERLKGLVLIDSAPNSAWQTAFGEKLKKAGLPNLDRLEKNYREGPSHINLRELTLASTPLLFTKKGCEKGYSLLASLPYNFEICNWSAENFDTTYEAKWIPKDLPTLILAGSEDPLTPLRLFSDLKEFLRPNILMREIPNAGHFPWIENPKEVASIFKQYAEAF